jgi:hypothetical protein
MRALIFIPILCDLYSLLPKGGFFLHAVEISLAMHRDARCLSKGRSCSPYMTGPASTWPRRNLATITSVRQGNVTQTLQRRRGLALYTACQKISFKAHGRRSIVMVRGASDTRLARASGVWSQGGLARQVADTCRGARAMYPGPCMTATWGILLGKQDEHVV